MTATTEDTEPPSAAPAAVPALRLLYSGTVWSDGLLVLDQGSLPIGRETTAPFAARWLNDRSMSRHHARIEVVRRPSGSPGKVPSLEVSIYDEGSTKGTYVNGVPVAMAELRDGDLIRLGNTLFMFRCEAERHVDAEVPALLGESRGVRLLRHRLMQAARGTAPVLVLGEVGVGKEVTAQAIHRVSGRTGPFVAFNCAALPESLAESELFGYAPKAFTDADPRGRAGFFQSADRGTLLLDEVGELPMPLQATLLRALAEKEVIRVGARQPEPIDVRIISATNRNLDQMVNAGTFRGDLLSRLRGAVLAVPPLRERREDILPLFLRGLRTPEHDPAPRLTTRLCEALLLYHWPFNVRELLQLAETLRPLLESEPSLDLPMVSEWHPLTRFEALVPTKKGQSALRPPRSLPAGRNAGELDPDSEIGPRLNRETLARLLAESEGNLSALARRIGRSRRQILRWMAEHGMARPLSPS